MTILSGTSIRDYAAKGMIDPFLDHMGIVDGTTVGPGEVSYNLRLGMDFTLCEGEVAAISPSSVGEDTWRDVFQGDGAYILLPGRFVMNKTAEKVDLPTFLMAEVRPKFAWASLGLIVQPTIIYPGYTGDVVISLYNAGSRALSLHPGVGIAQLVFHKVD